MNQPILDRVCSPNMGEQRDKILEAEKVLGIGPVELASLLSHPEKETSYWTLRGWKNESAVMPGSAWIAIDFLIAKARKK